MIDYSKLPDKAPDYDLRDLLEAGCHFGHQKSKWNPKMAPYIYMEKDGVHIFDLAQTAVQLKKAYNYLYKLGKEKKKVLFVGTKKQVKALVEKAAEEAGVMYITSRWLGGFLTNWQQISKSIDKMNKIEEGLKSGKYDHYTKYERVQLEKEKNRFERFFSGVSDIKRKPDCIVVVDPNYEENAVIEARHVEVPVIAIIDSNGDPDMVSLSIPANDDAVGSVEFLINELSTAYQKGKKASK